MTFANTSNLEQFQQQVLRRVKEYVHSDTKVNLATDLRRELALRDLDIREISRPLYIAHSLSPFNTPQVLNARTPADIANVLHGKLQSKLAISVPANDIPSMGSAGPSYLTVLSRYS